MAGQVEPFTLKAVGLSDTIDGSNAFKGAMLSLANLVQSPTTRGIWVPRPAVSAVYTFPGAFASPQFLVTPNGQFVLTPGGQKIIVTPGGFGPVTAMLTLGNVVYGMIGAIDLTYDQPFAYSVATGTLITITIPATAALPTSQPTSGDWTPPIMAAVGSRIMITHPGFGGASTGYYVGWIDTGGYVSNAITGNTHGTTTIDNLSLNVLTAGWKVGMIVTDSAGNIPANTTIKSIAAGGLSVVLTNPATSAIGGVTFTVSGGTAAAPLYGAGQVAGVGLNAVPVSVAQFSGRAYYAIGNGLQFSDSGDAVTITSAAQAITFQNGLPVTALAGLPLAAPLTGGIVGSLICFQGAAVMQQITGDLTGGVGGASTLASNPLSVATGTLAPNTICTTTKGLTFVAPDGLRMIDFAANVSDIVGAYGGGVVVPFQNALNPSRMCAAFNQNVLRLTCQNGAAAGTPMQEYWLDFATKAWGGPHQFIASGSLTGCFGLIQPYNAVGVNTFLAAWEADFGFGQIVRSDVIPLATSSYTDPGGAYPFAWQSSLGPDSTEGMANAISTGGSVAIALPVGINVSVQVFDDQNTQLDSFNLLGPTGSGTIWGSFTWGSATWGVPAASFYQQALPQTQAWLFRQMTLQYSGTVVAGLKIGNTYLKIRHLGYKLRTAA